MTDMLDIARQELEFHIAEADRLQAFIDTYERLSAAHAPRVAPRAPVARRGPNPYRPVAAPPLGQVEDPAEGYIDEDPDQVPGPDIDEERVADLVAEVASTAAPAPAAAASGPPGVQLVGRRVRRSSAEYIPQRKGA